MAEFEEGFGNIIVVNNLPVVPTEKFEKLEWRVRKIYSQIGVIKEDGLWMPTDPDTQKTLGYCFIEFNTPQEAELAKERTHGYKLDRSHIFSVNMFDDIEKFMKVPEEWKSKSKSYWMFRRRRLRYPFLFEEGFGNIIVVDNLPVVPKEKFEKLEGVVRKIYGQIGVIKEDGLWMPTDPDTQKTLGYCFIEYNTPQEAELAKERTHGYKLDRSHTFAVNMLA